MTPDEHAARAEQLLEAAENELNGAELGHMIARAHVHAILATRAPWQPPREPEQSEQPRLEPDPRSSVITPGIGSALGHIPQEYVLPPPDDESDPGRLPT